jgi:uncharacterized protein YdeI (YjbR/CyaY-like superfamily)
MDPKIESFFQNCTQWKEELLALRSILLECLLEETFKWKVPCYTYHSKNILVIHGFKDHCAIGFFKGALLLDEAQLLTQLTENSQAGRQFRFQNLASIIKNKDLIQSYVYEAIEIEKNGFKIEYKSAEEFAIPEELTEEFTKNSAFEEAFYRLTPGRQKGYLLHFANAKQSSTRTSRILQAVPRILTGKGLTDCTCGLSKRMPSCDGSHKQLKKVI